MTNKDAFEQVNDAIYGEDTMDVKDFVIGALIGGIVGAAAALLLAPKSGSELRGDVAIQAVSLKDKSVELSHVAKDKTAQLSSQIKEQSTHLVDKVMTKSPKVPTDDGTVSLEGEEPLSEVNDAVEVAVADAAQGIETVEDKVQEMLIESSEPKN
ncbi:MAG: YtxH domain-containing protein [Solibacillus sp.]